MFPGSEEKTDDIKPPKHDHCDFETSLRIQIRHDSDNEWEYCTYNKKDSFSIIFAILQSSRAHSQILLWRSQCLKVKTGALHKKNHIFFLYLAFLKGHFHNEKKKKKSARACSTPGRTCTSLSYINGKRSFTVRPLTLFFASLLAPAPNSSSTVVVRPQREAQMRAVSPSRYTKREREAHTIVAKERKRGKHEGSEKWKSRWASGKYTWVCVRT